MTPSTTTESLPIAQAAERAGLSIDTLRYYERAGLLLSPVRRGNSGHRQYRAEDLKWIELVTKLRSTGMSIADVRHYADLVRAGEGNEAERLDLLRAHREQVLDKMRQTQAHLKAIEYKIARYEDSTNK